MTEFLPYYSENPAHERILRTGLTPEQEKLESRAPKCRICGRFMGEPWIHPSCDKREAKRGR